MSDTHEDEDEAGRHGLDELRAQRQAKVDALRADGIDPYPTRFDRSHTTAEVRAGWPDLEAGAETDDEVRVAGRVVLLRRQGKLVFAQLRDVAGDLQLFVSRAAVGDEAFERIAALDLGDWVGATGTVMVTRKGELSVGVTALELLSKALRPLPDKWHGLTDVEARYRQREVDLVVNPEARRVLEVRTRTVAALRARLAAQGYVEVETPVLHHEVGGATARPFVTHHNALGIDLYLRIALELHLKRLVVGGIERVFEIGRVFRNEGIDTRHNPEFTMLEAYEALADHVRMMELTEDLLRAAATAATGGTEVTVGETTIDLGAPFRRATMSDLLREHLDVELHPSMPLEQARATVEGLGLEVEAGWGAGRCCHHAYDELVEHRLVQPTFVLEHPAETSPLAKATPGDPDVVERFELIVGGSEIAAYNDVAYGLQKAAKYYYYPGWQEPGPGLETIIHKDAWDSLPPDLQEIVRMCCQAITTDMAAEYTHGNAESLMQIQQDTEVEVRRFPDEVIWLLKSHADKVVEELMERDPASARIGKAYYDYLAKASENSRISEQAYLDTRDL